jgi:prephenate dehydrogenase
MERLQAAVNLGMIDAYATDLGDAVKDAAIVVVCTPVDHIVQDVLELSKVCKPGTIITDVGSVKGSIYSSIREFMSNEVEYVGGHPLAGSEKTGFEHAFAELYQNRYVVVTPDEDTSPRGLQIVTELWEFVGAHVVQVNPMQHDEILARTSHLPHVVAFSLAMILKQDIMPYCASGFKDTTRIAASDADLWTAIFKLNKNEVLSSIDEYRTALNRLRHGIFHEDWQEVHSIIQHAKQNRDQLNNVKLPTQVD